MNLDTRSKAIIATVILVAVWFGQGYAGASSWAPRDGCGHVVTGGETLGELAALYGVSMLDIADNSPDVNPNNLDHIERGWRLDVCAPSFDMRMDRGLQPAPVETVVSSVSLSRAETVDVPARLFDWALAVSDTAPEWATPADVLFVTAVSGPESNHGHPNTIWNSRDASADGKWLGSYGYIQIRILANPAAYPSDSYRDLTALEGNIDAQARAAWTVLGRQGRNAWGPSTDGKLPNETCTGATDVDRCLTWWAQGRAALAGVGVFV